MNTLNEIHDFLESREFAIAGASRNPKKFGGTVFKELTDKGFQLIPVNPNADELYGVKCYSNVSELPDDLQYLYIVTPKSQTEEIVKQAIQRGFKMIWVQQGSETPGTIEMLVKSGIPFVCKKCILMFADPVKGVHGFHRFLTRTFGAYPKMVAPSAN